MSESSKEQKDFNPRRIKQRFKARPVGSNKEIHWFEAEYEETSSGVWQKVYGTEKDLGPAD